MVAVYLYNFVVMSLKSKILSIKWGRALAIAAIGAVATACGSTDSFTIDGEIAGGGTATVEFTYYADGAVKRATAAAHDGKFRIEGASAAPTLGFLTISGGNPVAAVVVENGDDIECEVGNDNNAGWKAKGNKASELLARFSTENAELIAAGAYREINNLVADYVRSHPNEAGSAALLVTRFYSRGNEFLADSLAGLLNAEVRTPAMMHNFMASLSNQLTAETRANVSSMALFERRDTTVRFTPSRQSVALLAFVGTDRRMRDSIVPRLRELSLKWPEKRCKVIEVSLAQDSSAWKQSVARDSATWIQAWAPGTVASTAFRRLAVSRNPFFIVADSVGKQLFRGSEITDAVNTVENHLANR